MRDKMIDALVQNDFDSIMSGDATELLNSYLEFGHKGYRDYSDLELIQECAERDIPIELIDDENINIELDDISHINE
jgi:hypothetical protein